MKLITFDKDHIAARVMTAIKAAENAGTPAKSIDFTQAEYDELTAELGIGVRSAAGLPVTVDGKELPDPRDAFLKALSDAALAQQQQQDLPPNLIN